MGRTVDKYAAIEQQLAEIEVALDAIRLLLLADDSQPASWEDKLIKKEGK